MLLFTKILFGTPVFPTCFLISIKNRNITLESGVEMSEKNNGST